MDNFLQSLPPEFQAEMQKILRQRQMAQAMQQQSLASMNAPTQFSGGRFSHAVKTNPLATAMQMFTSTMAGKGMEEGDKAQADMVGRYQTQTREGMQKLLAPGVDPTSGLADSNPRIAALAKALLDRKQKQGETVSGVLKDVDPKAAIGAAMGNLPGPDYNTPVQPGPTFGDYKDHPYAITTGAHGRKEIKFAPKGSNISVDARQAKDVDKAAMEEVRPTMKSWQEKATAAKEVIQANGLALDALSRGAKAGGLEGLKQSLRGIAQGFGVNTDKFTETTELQMAVGNAILANARKLAPVTAEDIRRLETILGSVSTDSTALEKMLTEYNGMAAKTLQDANRYFDQTEEIMPTDLSKGLVRAGSIGHEMIPPPGNTNQALRAIQTLQRQGGDPTQFAVGGNPIEPGAQFNIRGTPPQTPTPGPGTIPKKPIEQMTPQEVIEEIQLLRQRLGK
jgi:hypothetical protein